MLLQQQELPLGASTILGPVSGGLWGPPNLSLCRIPRRGARRLIEKGCGIVGPTFIWNVVVEGRFGIGPVDIEWAAYRQLWLSHLVQA